MATREERSLVRAFFQCRVIRANGKNFQDLFWDVMKAKHGRAFATVAPQGRKGDGGNDGYHPVNKHYFQLFAPVDPKDKIKKAASKLAEDFGKIILKWAKNNSSDIKQYSFAFNDKYEGVPYDVEQALGKLRKQHGSITFEQYSCRDLEADFLGLDSMTAWDNILGAPLPDPSRLAGIDYSVLTEVVRFIMCAEIHPTSSRLTLPPELDEKIELTNLSQANAIFIQHGALQTGHITRYFQAHTTFALQELREHVVGCYETAKQCVSSSSPKGKIDSDTVFNLFRRTLCPKNPTVATSAAVDAIIGYFFEACDIFDPKANKGEPGAAP